MFLQVHVEQQHFKLSIGQGYNDWVWLAHYASKIYSKSIYPQGTYLPTLLYLENIHKQIPLEYHPHPREKIFKYFEAYGINYKDVRCVVRIRKANHNQSELQKKWQRQAYGKEQYLITFNLSYTLANINRKRDFKFQIRTQYQMCDQVKHLFNEKQFPGEIRTTLEEQEAGENQCRFCANFQLPLGSTIHSLLYLERESPQEEYSQTEVNLKRIKKQDFIIGQQPLYVPRSLILSMMEKQMKIQEDIGRSLEQKQLETKKRNASSSLCCFTFQELWDAIQKQYGQDILLAEYKNSTVERIKLLIEKNIDGLYEIFFYYFILEKQQKERKEQLAVNYQHVMHFLKNYRVFSESQSLAEFFEYYNAYQNKYSRIQDTLDVNNHSVRFPHFVAILLRAIQFLQSSVLIMKGETFDSAANKVFTSIVEAQEQRSELSFFWLNLSQNPKIILFIRENSEKLKQVYVWMFKQSTQSTSAISIGKQEFKLLLINFKLTQNGSNIDKLLDECWRELNFKEKDFFYYDLLVIVEWIAMALIKEDKQEDVENFNEDEEAEMIVQKMKYFIGKINLN